MCKAVARKLHPKSRLSAGEQREANLSTEDSLGPEAGVRQPKVAIFRFTEGDGVMNLQSFSMDDHPRNRKCLKCGASAVVQYRGLSICRGCLCPEPSAEYVRLERERITGSYGVVSLTDWEYH
jgi:hypothetical protein